jgi:hypothetical protein
MVNRTSWRDLEARHSLFPRHSLVPYDCDATVRIDVQREGGGARCHSEGCESRTSGGRVSRTATAEDAEYPQGPNVHLMSACGRQTRFQESFIERTQGMRTALISFFDTKKRALESLAMSARELH